MLPILRILPVGGVLLAILILVLALSPPDATRSPLTAAIAPARGALVNRDHHEEQRQFLIHAALKRADELNRLRDLPDTPARSSEAQVAGLPSERSDTDPDEPASTNEMPSGSIPVEIGEPSSTELPVTLHQEDNTPPTKRPERDKREVRHRAVHRVHRTRVTTGAAPSQRANFFEIFFGGQQYQKSAYKNQQATQLYPQPAYGTQRYQQPPYSVQQSDQRYQQPPYVDPQTNQSAFSTVPPTNPY